MEHQLGEHIAVFWDTLHHVDHGGIISKWKNQLSEINLLVFLVWGWDEMRRVCSEVHLYGGGSLLSQHCTPIALHQFEKQLFLESLVVMGFPKHASWVSIIMSTDSCQQGLISALIILRAMPFHNIVNGAMKICHHLVIIKCHCHVQRFKWLSPQLSWHQPCRQVRRSVSNQKKAKSPARAPTL